MKESKPLNGIYYYVSEEVDKTKRKVHKNICCADKDGDGEHKKGKVLKIQRPLLIRPILEIPSEDYVKHNGSCDSNECRKEFGEEKFEKDEKFIKSLTQDNLDYSECK